MLIIILGFLPKCGILQTWKHHDSPYRSAGLSTRRTTKPRACASDSRCAGEEVGELLVEGGGGWRVAASGAEELVSRNVPRRGKDPSVSGGTTQTLRILIHLGSGEKIH